MVDIEVKDGQVSFRPRGLSKLWTMRNQITVPRSAIRSVRRAPPGVGPGWWKGWRLPGTHLPGVITAGSYLHDGEWEFWDVRGAGASAIQVELGGTRYRRLIIDVEDPAGAVARLSQ